MIRKENWSYADLLNMFGSKKTNKERFFEHFLYSISELSDFESIMCENSIDGVIMPYCDYLPFLVSSLKNAHKFLPDYLKEPSDEKDYEKIKDYINCIRIVQNDTKTSWFNFLKKCEAKRTLKKMMSIELSLKQVLNYFFLKVMEEENIIEEEFKVVFIMELKNEMLHFAKDFPSNAKFLNL